MGSGKSSVGRILAKRLGWIFFDTDEMVEKQVGLPVATIIRKQGEKEFRTVEKQAVRLVSLSDRCVLSTGGGVPLEPENFRELSRDGIVIWLKASPESILHRIKDIASRPLLDPQNPELSVRKLLEERAKAYGQAQYIVETDGLSRDQVVDKILALLPHSLQ